MANFIMLVGLSGSGKSTYAEKICKQTGAVHLASDKVRDAIYGTRRIQDNPSLIFEICQKAAIENLIRGRSVVLDATNLMSKNRIQTLQAIKKAVPETYCEAHVIVNEFDECIKQNVRREFAVPRTVIEKQVRQFQIPFDEEGWDRVRLVPPKEYIFSDNMILRYIAQEIHRLGDDFDQHTPYHSFTLGEHCKNVDNYICNNYFLKKDVDDLTLEDVALATAAEIHDYGKLLGHTEDDNGVWHYYGHAEIGAYQILCDCVRKSVPTDINRSILDGRYEAMIEMIIHTVFYVNYHMMPFNWRNEKEHNKAKALYGGEKYKLLMLLHEADLVGKVFDKEVK